MSQMSDKQPLSLPQPPFPSEKLQNSILNNKYLQATLVVCSIVLIVAIVLCFCRKKKVFLAFKRRKDKIDAHELMLRKFQVEELKIATNNFDKECLIGSGAFGNVYKGTFEGNISLAIKRAHDDAYTSTKEFRNEVKLLSKVKHRNLVGLVGYCEETGTKGVQILVYEFVPNGSLLEHIVGREREPLTWRQRVNIAIQAAKGIAHLHEGIKPSIIHRDIKPSNILIGDGFEAKVSDFGLVRSGPVGDDKSYVTSQIKGTPGYLDPAYCTSFHLSPFSDVYSFGVILLQLIAARPAVDSNRSRSSYHIIEWARPHLEQGNVEEILDTNLLLEPCNMEIMLKMGLLGLRCVVKEPKQRPTMTQVVKELEAALWLANSNKGNRQRSLRSLVAPNGGRSLGRRDSQVTDQDSSISLDGVGLQRFRVEMDSLSFQSMSLRCLEADSLVFHIDYESKVVDDETSLYMDDYSIPRD